MKEETAAEFICRRSFAKAGACGLAGYALAQKQALGAEQADAAALPVHNILDHGAVGDGKTSNTKAFATTIAACAKAGGGTVLAPPAFFSHALQLEDVADIAIDGFAGRQPHVAGETIALNRVNGISISASKAAEGADTFIGHQAVTDARLFTNNDLLDAKRAFHPPKPGFTTEGNLFPAARSRK